ncbi:MAG: hypothetical protein ACTSRZ_16740 [Promethearchaeota archaeon]
MSFVEIIAMIMNFALIAVYAYLFWFFRKKFAEQQKAGYTNMFLRGYSFMFFFLLIFQIGASIVNVVDLLSKTFHSTQLQVPFPGKPTDLIPFIAFISNLLRPIFILGLISLELLFAAQIYPLEKALNWNKTPGVKFMIITALAQFLLFIPIITWTVFGALIIYTTFAGLFYGFFMNIAVNIKLAISTTGEIKRRSIIIIFASFLFYLGFVWRLEVGWTRIIIPLLDELRWDIVFGSFVIIIAAFLYRNGLSGKIT